MKLKVTRGILDVLVKQAAEVVLSNELEEKFKVIRITAAEGALSVEARCVDSEVLVVTRDAEIAEDGSVQIDFSKFQQLVGQVNVDAVIESTESQCVITSGAAVWRLKVHNFSLTKVDRTTAASGVTIRSETIKDVLLRLRPIVSSEEDATLDAIRMVALSGNSGLVTDRVRVVGVMFEPAIPAPINLSRHLADTLLKFISVTGEPDFVICDEGDFYSIHFRKSFIKSKKLASQFPVQQVQNLFTQVTVPWFDVRVADLVDGLKKAVVTSEYGEPRVKFVSDSSGHVTLISEDVLGNRGSVVIAANVKEIHEAFIRAELIKDLIDSAKGERLDISLYEGKFIKLTSEGVTGILMTMSVPVKGKPSAAGSKSTKSSPKEGVGAGPGPVSEGVSN